MKTIFILFCLYPVFLFAQPNAEENYGPFYEEMVWINGRTKTEILASVKSTLSKMPGFTAKKIFEDEGIVEYAYTHICKVEGGALFHLNNKNQPVTYKLRSFYVLRIEVKEDGYNIQLLDHYIQEKLFATLWPGLGIVYHNNDWSDTISAAYYYRVANESTRMPLWEQRRSLPAIEKNAKRVVAKFDKENAKIIAQIKDKIRRTLIKMQFQK